MRFKIKLTGYYDHLWEGGGPACEDGRHYPQMRLVDTERCRIWIGECDPGMTIRIMRAGAIVCLGFWLPPGALCLGPYCGSDADLPRCRS
jgi:hypothetical protein